MVESETSHHANLTRKQCMTSPVFILNTVWFAVLNLRFSMYFATLNDWLLDSTDGDIDKGKWYVYIFVINKFRMLYQVWCVK